MGLLARLLDRTPPSTSRRETIVVHASQLVEVVGESYRQDVLRRVSRRATFPAAFVDDLSGHAQEIAEREADSERWFLAALMREPSNKHDPNAIAVYADGVGHVGYLSRDEAIDYQPVFEALRARGCAVASCPAFLIGGEPGKPSYGVMLCLSSPELIIRDLAESMPA